MLLLGQLIRPVVWLQAFPGTWQAKSPGIDYHLPLLLAQNPDTPIPAASYLYLYPALRGSMTRSGLELPSMTAAVNSQD